MLMLITAILCCILFICFGRGRAENCCICIGKFSLVSMLRILAVRGFGLRIGVIVFFVRGC